MLKSSPALSVIVPYEHEDIRFEDTLASVLRYLPPQTQLIVVHDGSYHDPHQLDEVDFVVTAKHVQLAGQLGAALRVADAPLIGLVRSGVELDEGWQESVFEAFVDERVASVSPAIVSEDRPGKLLTAGVQVGSAFKRKLVGTGVRLGRKSRQLRPIGPTSWAGFYRREVLDLLGTPDEQLENSYLDLDLALGIRQLGYENEFQQECVLTVRDGSLIQSEVSQPHGVSAARAKTRFGDRSSMVGESLIELLAAPFRPWLVKHVVGKLSARSMKDIDEAYWRRLVRNTELRKAADGAAEVQPAHRIQDEYRRAA